MRELVEAAGVTKPTLYYYFESKEGLFLDVARGLLADLDGLVARALQAQGGLQGQLDALLLDNVHFASKNPDSVRFLMTCLHQVDHAQPAFDLMSLDATFVRHLGGVFAQAVDRGELRSDIDVPLAVISFLGIVRAWSLAAFHGAPIPAGFHQTVVRQYLQGIAHP